MPTLVAVALLLALGCGCPLSRGPESVESCPTRESEGVGAEVERGAPVPDSDDGGVETCPEGPPSQRDPEETGFGEDCDEGLRMPEDDSLDDREVSACWEAPVRSGRATWYRADGTGNCSFPLGTGMPFVAAAGDADYDEARLCGACVEVMGPRGVVAVKIVDRCPECGPGHLDLSREAFAEISNPAEGIAPITWRVIECEDTGPLVLFFEQGSDEWWSSVQVREHRHPLAALEARVGDAEFAHVERKQWNVHHMHLMGLGPFDFRLTDVHGNEVLLLEVPMSPGLEVEGDAQFPDCG